MQRRRIINQELKKQNISLKKRKFILYVFEKQYDGILQYVDQFGKVRIEENLHFLDELLPCLRKLGYNIVFEDGKMFAKPYQGD